MLKIAMFSMNKNNSIKAVVAEALKKATIKRKISQGSEVAISIPEPVDPTVRNIIMGRLKRLEHFMLSASFGSGGVRLMATTSMTDEGRIRSVLEANLGDEAMFGKVQLNKTGGIDLTSDKALSVQTSPASVLHNVFPKPANDNQSITALKAA